MKHIKNFLPLIVIVLLVSSIGLFIANRGFKHSEYQEFYKVDFSGEFNTEEVFDRIKNTAGLIEIDKPNNTAYYQNIDSNTLNQSITESLKEIEGITTSTSKIIPSIGRTEKLSSLGLAVALFTALLIGFTFVTKTRLFNWNLKQYLIHNGFYVLSTVAVLTILLGLISLISLVYKVNDYLLFSIIFVIVVKALMFWFKYTSEDLKEAKSYYLASLRLDYTRMLLTLLIIGVFLIVGLGVKSVLPLCLLAASIIISGVVDYSILKFFSNRRVSATGQSTKNDTKAYKIPGQKQYNPNPKLKKKNKPKKK